MVLSEISIRRPVFAWMLMCALIVFGGISFMKMGISQLPDVDFPIVSISVNWEGSSPETMETDVIDVIENSIMGIQGVKQVTSSSKSGVGSITVEFSLDRNIDLALQDVQAKIAQVQKALPKDITAPSIAKTNPEDQPIMWLSVNSDKYTRPELMTYVRDHVRDQFSTISGIGDISLSGYIEPNLRVWVRGEDLAHYDLAVTDVVNTFQQEHLEPPAGDMSSSKQEFNLRTIGEVSKVEDFQNLFINFRGGQPNFKRIQLKQVADVVEGLSDAKTVSRAVGKIGVGIGIRKQRGANSVEIARAVRAKMKEVEPTLPSGMNIATTFDTTKFIEDAVGELNFTLMLSALLTALICWLFLGSWSSTVNVLMAIPTSIIGSFIALSFLGFTLNTFTLLALSLSIGIVVDDAIMVLENIVRHKEMKKSRMQAAIDGSLEITFAAVAATVAIIAIFLPIAFMDGIIGKFLYQFGVTLTVAVLISLLEALTLTPMRCAQFVSVEERTTRLGKGIEAVLHGTTALYKRSLHSALNHRWTVIIGSFIVFAVSVYTVNFLNKEFLPSEDQSRFIIRLQTPVGSTIEFTDEKAKQIEAFLASRPEVVRYNVSLGGNSGSDANSGFMFVTLVDKSKRKLSQQEFINLCRTEFKKIPDVKPILQDLSTRGFTASRGFPVEFTLLGPDWTKLADLSKQIMSEMDKSGMMTDIDTDYKLGMPEIRVIPDRNLAAAHGVSVASVGQTISSMLSGVIVGRYAKNGRRFDIRVKMKDDKRTEKEKIESIRVRNNRGELIPLSKLVTIQESPSLQVINRSNRERAVTVYSNIKQGQSQQKAIETVQEIAGKILPDGYHIRVSGSAQSFQDSFRSLLFALILGIVVAYMVLASQFNSFLDPVIVLLAIPFSVSGAFVALWMTHQSLNIYSMIGLVLLMGIVKKNSILLVDFTNQKKAEGLSVHDALTQACPVRLRPILMTSISVIVGAIPPALAIGPGAESRIPMSVTVIGGVLLSTILTLYVVPAAYSLMSREKKQ